MEPIIIILIISVLGPVIGSFIGVVGRPKEGSVNKMLAFAAGTMIAISFLELIPEAIGISSVFHVVVGIVLGSIIILLLDTFIPHIHPEGNLQEQGRHLKRTAVYLLVGIFLHNIPEGMAIAIGEVTNIRTALMIALAIAIHNIPEGVCTSAPYYFVTKNRVKAFFLSASTAIPIVIGFFLATFLFRYLSHSFVGIILAMTAGVMIYISADELIPTACNKRGKCWSHGTIASLIAGVLLVLVLSSFT